jgi:hypothetical protein
VIARPGWLRRWYRVAYAIAEFVVLVGLLFGVPALIWILGVANDLDVAR